MPPSVVNTMFFIPNILNAVKQSIHGPDSFIRPSSVARAMYTVAFFTRRRNFAS